jgi:uncharacterized membrane protein YhaH (DUF805 family)
MNYFFQALKKYATFSGRARRKEFWYFILFSFILQFVVSAVLGFVERSFLLEEGQEPFLPGVVSILFNLGLFLPTWAVIWRRMHDVGKSGWFGLIPIYNLILACQDGNKAENRFGADPKG